MTVDADKAPPGAKTNLMPFADAKKALVREEAEAEPPLPRQPRQEKRAHLTRRPRAPAGLEHPAGSPRNLTSKPQPRLGAAMNLLRMTGNAIKSVPDRQQRQAWPYRIPTITTKGVESLLVLMLAQRYTEVPLISGLLEKMAESTVKYANIDPVEALVMTLGTHLGTEAVMNVIEFMLQPLLKEQYRHGEEQGTQVGTEIGTQIGTEIGAQQSHDRWSTWLEEQKAAGAIPSEVVPPENPARHSSDLRHGTEAN